MKTAGIMLVKDEIDIIEITLRHLLTQVDFVLVSDNISSDGTWDLLVELASTLPIIVSRDESVGYWQSRKMTQLASKAHELGASFIVPCDADEFPFTPWKRLGDLLQSLHPATMIVTADLYDYVATWNDPEDPNPVRRLRWRREMKAPLPKISCRYRPDLVIEAGNHGAKYDRSAITVESLYQIRHFPYRSPEQMVKKVRNGAAAYAATDLPSYTGAHWRGYGQILAEKGEKAIHDIFYRWFYSENPEKDGLIYDPAPVQFGGKITGQPADVGKYSCTGGPH